MVQFGIQVHRIVDSTFLFYVFIKGIVKIEGVKISKSYRCNIAVDETHASDQVIRRQPTCDIYQFFSLLNPGEEPFCCKGADNAEFPNTRSDVQHTSTKSFNKKIGGKLGGPYCRPVLPGYRFIFAG